MESEVVGLGRYVRAVRRRGWIVVATILVFAVGAAGYVALRPAQYSATAQVLIKPYSAAQFNEPVFTTEQVDTQVAVMESLAVVSPVTKQLGLQEAPSDLVKDISSAAVGDTSIVSITVTRDNPQEAAQIANAVGLSYLSFRASQQPPGARNSSSGVIVNSALPPTHPAGTSPLRAGIFGAAVGLVIGCLLALVVARRDPSLADEAAVAEVTGGLPVLGRVPKRRYRSGTLTLLERPGSSEALAYRFLATKLRVLTERDAPSPESTPTVALVVSAAPREGRTSVAANLALAAAEAGRHVLLCDLDLTHPALTAMLASGRPVTVDDLLRGRREADLDSLARPAPTLFVLGTEETRRSAAASLGSGAFRRLVSRVASQVDLVVVDTSPLLSSADMLELLPQADVVLLTVRERFSTSADVTAALDQIGQLGGAVTGVVLTSSTSPTGTQRPTRRRANAAAAASSGPPTAAASTAPTQASKR